MKKPKHRRTVTAQQFSGVKKLEPISEQHDSSVVSASREEKQQEITDVKQLENIFPGSKLFEPADNSMLNFDINESSIKLTGISAFRSNNIKNKQTTPRTIEPGNNNFQYFSRGLEDLCNESIWKIIDECNVDYNRRVTIMSQFTADRIKKGSCWSKRPSQFGKFQPKSSSNQYDQIFCNSRPGSDDGNLDDDDEDSDNDQYSTLMQVKKGELEFFKLLFLSAMLNVPSFMLNYLQKLNPEQLFCKALLVENLKFHQFSEWIDMEIKKQLYRRDAQFLELELLYIKKKEQEIIIKKDQLTTK